jgi:hypothetical protein
MQEISRSLLVSYGKLNFSTLPVLETFISATVLALPLQARVPATTARLRGLLNGAHVCFLT